MTTGDGLGTTVAQRHKKTTTAPSSLRTEPHSPPGSNSANSSFSRLFCDFWPHTPPPPTLKPQPVLGFHVPLSHPYPFMRGPGASDAGRGPEGHPVLFSLPWVLVPRHPGRRHTIKHLPPNSCGAPTMCTPSSKPRRCLLNRTELLIN